MPGINESVSTNSLQVPPTFSAGFVSKINVEIRLSGWPGNAFPLGHQGLFRTLDGDWKIKPIGCVVLGASAGYCISGVLPAQEVQAQKVGLTGCKRGSGRVDQLYCAFFAANSVKSEHPRKAVGHTLAQCSLSGRCDRKEVGSKVKEFSLRLYFLFGHENKVLAVTPSYQNGSLFSRGKHLHRISI
jgi:hypothetical protein